MRILVLGRERRASWWRRWQRNAATACTCWAKENQDASALTPPFVAGFDVVIDFTTPEAVVQNMRACLATGAKMVVGTTGWYEQLADMRGLCERRQGALLYGTNFSIGVQGLFRVARTLAEAAPGYTFTITETHHATKIDAPSGTALSLKRILESARPGLSVEITSIREGEVPGIHVVEARSANDCIELKHEAYSRRSFAEGAVRAAEWIAGKTGCWDFQEIVSSL